MLDTFAFIDPDATPAENVGAVLAFRDEVAHSDAFQREQAAKFCERHRGKILRGYPPFGVLRAIERGYAPAWVEDTLRRRIVYGNHGEVALAAVA